MSPHAREAAITAVLWLAVAAAGWVARGWAGRTSRPPRASGPAEAVEPVTPAAPPGLEYPPPSPRRPAHVPNEWALALASHEPAGRVLAEGDEPRVFSRRGWPASVRLPARQGRHCQHDVTALWQQVLASGRAMLPR